MIRPSTSIFGIGTASLAVFCTAIILRVPSCYESFWIDELHSAWVVWDSLGDVTPRAKLGHQSPFYFVGLWFWKQIVGGGEVALRLSSILAVALSGVVLTVGIGRWSGNVFAGFVAGMLLATESNALFFGTELRPYAMVILFGSIALTSFLPLLDTASRHEGRWHWFRLNAAVLLAALCQPTSIGLLLLPVVLLLNWSIRSPRNVLRFNLSDAFILLGGFAVGFALWNATLKQTWQERGAWASFASATRWRQIYSIWDWEWLWLTPIVVSVIAIAIACASRKIRSIRPVMIATIVLALMSVIMTCTYWWVSWMHWVPVWHRRYFIAVLPMFACLSGSSVALLTSSLGENRVARYVSPVAAAALILLVPFQQGVLQRLPRYPVALVARGEDWRSAMEWVRFKARPNDLIYLDAGLIENQTLLLKTLPALGGANATPDQLEYLTYAGLGPYPLKRRAIPINLGGSLLFPTENASRRVYVIVRRPISKLRTMTVASNMHMYSFGNVTVLLQASHIDGLIL